MPETRATLVDLPSGKIELVLLGGMLPVLEFNCTCEDALPYCHAICCRMRSGTNAVLTPEEAARLESLTLKSGLTVLKGNPDDSCVYLDSQSELCKIHETKPEACRTFHCSPNGMGEGLTLKDKGWFLSPMGSLLRQGSV